MKIQVSPTLVLVKDLCVFLCNLRQLSKVQLNFLKEKKMDLIFTDLNSENKKLRLNKLTHNPTCVIIGPEGDFSEEERKEILGFDGVQPIKINDNILRSETAVISALSIVNYLIN